MGNNSPIDQDHSLWILLAEARHAMFKVRQRELHRRYNLTIAQAAVLVAVNVLCEQATPSHIAQWLFREIHSVSGILSRMEEQGLVRKCRDQDKKSIVRVSLTEDGHKLYRKVIKRESVHEIMSSLSEEQCQQLTSCLETLRLKAIKELGMEINMPFARF